MKLLFSQTVLFFVVALSFSVAAEDYDLYQRGSEPCSGAWNNNGTVYTCSGSVTLEKGDTISYSGPLDSVTFKVNDSIQFDGSNTVGSVDKSVSLASDYGTITFSGESNQVFGSIRASANIILNNIEVSAPITTTYGLIKITGNSNPNGVNTVIGNIKNDGNVELENIVLKGSIDTGGNLKVTGSSNTIDGVISANGYIEAENINAKQTIESGRYLKVTGKSNQVYGDITVSESISILATENRVTGSISAGNWIKLSNINVQGHVTSRNDYITISGLNNSISGYIEANNNVTLNHVDVAGYVKSRTGKVTLTGERNSIDGEVFANEDIKLSNVTVDGNVISGTTKVEITGSDNKINGNILTNTDIKLNNIVVNGDIKTVSTTVEITGSGNRVNGNISANNEIDLNNIQVCGVVDSTYRKVVIKGTDNGVYADQYAITAAQDIEIENTDVCGLVSSKWGQLKETSSTIYCSLNGNCEDGATACPSDVSCEGGTDPEEPEDYEVFVEPSTLLALTCETVQVRVEVHKDKTLDRNYSNSVKLTLSDGTTQSAVAHGGIALFNIDSLKVAELAVNASITVGSTQHTSAKQSVKFVPERYRVTPSIINMVAGTAADFSLTPLECNANGTPVTSPEFTGVQILNLSAVSYSKPALPIVRQTAQVLDRNSRYVTTPNSGSVNLSLDFGNSDKEASASSKLKYSEAGKVTMTLSSTVCSSEEQGESASAAEDCRTYDGVVVVQARPWTMAICDSNNAVADGTSNSNPTTAENGRYRAAGQEFDLHVKPIKWQSGLDALSQNHAEFCEDADLVTKNYFAKDAWSDRVTLTHRVATPSNGQSGAIEGNTTLDKTDGVQSSDYFFNFSQLNISEVGSFIITAASTGGNYGDIESGIVDGARTLGRFYPAYFTLENFAWNEAPDQGAVNYMNQPFKQITATAYAHSVSGHKLGNYHLSGFDNNRVEFPSLSDEQGYAERVENWYSVDAWQAEADGENVISIWSPQIEGVVFARKQANDAGVIEQSGERITEADGPYNTSETVQNTSLALDIAPGTLNDPVSYVWGEERLSSTLNDQPQVRYGRMMLADVLGNVSDSISVPLKVEYYDGTGFVTNKDDSASEFDVNKYCLLSDVTTNAKFSLSSGQANVTEGENNALRVSRTETVSDPEQVRLFLRQGGVTTSNPSDVVCSGNQFTQPWLQFNWRGKGDEDPSTFVIFGAYRGNDRIIFRGEPGLTGQ